MAIHKFVCNVSIGLTLAYEGRMLASLGGLDKFNGIIKVYTWLE